MRLTDVMKPTYLSAADAKPGYAGSDRAPFTMVALDPGCLST
jgi:hypothetical protein